MVSRALSLFGALACLLAASWLLLSPTQPSQSRLRPAALAGAATPSKQAEEVAEAPVPQTGESAAAAPLPRRPLSLSKEERRVLREMQIAPPAARIESLPSVTDLPDAAEPAAQDDVPALAEVLPSSAAFAGQNCKWERRFLSTAYGPPWNAVEGGPETKTGKPLVPYRYYVAVDPQVIPLGSKLKIWPNPLGYRGTFSAEDIGSAIKGDHIDIFVWQGKELRDNWKQNVQVCLVS